MLNLRQVEAFRATMTSGSVTAAGRVMNITQPSVTRLLSDLGAAVGFKLFTRHRRGMIPTSEARLFFAQVERSFLGLRELEASVDEIRDFSRSRLVIGASPGVALEFVPAMIAEFNKRHGPVTLSAHVSDSDRILDRVRAGRLSLALMTPIETPADIDILAEWSFAYVAMMRDDHPLARSRRPLDVKRLEPGLLIAPAPAFIAAKCRNAEAAEIQRRTGTTVEVSFAAAAMVRHGLGVALVDPFTARFFGFQPDLVVRPLRSGPTYDLMLAQPRRLTASRLQAAFAEELQRGVNAIGGVRRRRGCARRTAREV